MKAIEPALSRNFTASPVSSRSANVATIPRRASTASSGRIAICLLTLVLSCILPACRKEAAPPAALSPGPAERKAADAAMPAPVVEQVPDRVVAVDTTAKPATTPAQKAAVVRTLNSVPLSFDPGAGSVSDASMQAVKETAAALAATPDLRVRISLAANGNEKLARDRAEALKVQLIVNGVSAGAIDTDVRAGQASAADTVSFVDATDKPAR